MRDTTDAEAELERLAQSTGGVTDPNAEFEDSLEGFDPFDLWEQIVLASADYAEGTKDNYRRAIRFWREYMDEQGRHPAAPNLQHVKGFARSEAARTSPDTAEKRLGRLAKVYTWFQNRPQLPHTTDYHPFHTALEEMTFEASDPDPPRPMDLEDVAEVVRGITNIYDRSVVMAGLKWGIRGSEVCNIKLSEIHIANEDLLNHYPDMATHPAVAERPDSVFIPHTRKLNKSLRPRTIPIDDEMKRALLRYLLARPDVDEPWLFLSWQGAHKRDHDQINQVWHKYFRPEWGPIDGFRGVSAHYGRHYLTTHLTDRVPRRLIQYLRGDKHEGGDIGTGSSAIDHYIHTYYPEVREAYIDHIYKFHV